VTDIERKQNTNERITTTREKEEKVEEEVEGETFRTGLSIVKESELLELADKGGVVRNRETEQPKHEEEEGRGW
jgi:hypothetical protein